MMNTEKESFVQLIWIERKFAVRSLIKVTLSSESLTLVAYKYLYSTEKVYNQNELSRRSRNHRKDASYTDRLAVSSTSQVSPSTGNSLPHSSHNRQIFTGMSHV